jgi:hypothetical protein
VNTVSSDKNASERHKRTVFIAQACSGHSHGPGTTKHSRHSPSQGHSPRTVLNFSHSDTVRVQHRLHCLCINFEANTRHTTLKLTSSFICVRKISTCTAPSRGRNWRLSCGAQPALLLFDQKPGKGRTVLHSVDFTYCPDQSLMRRQKECQSASAACQYARQTTASPCQSAFKFGRRY